MGSRETTDLLRNKMTAHAKPKRDNSLLDIVCENPMQIVAKVRQYFSHHAQDLIDLGDLPSQLGISKQCLEVSFEQVRGMSLAQDLQEHRLNRLFAALTDHPRQGLGHAIKACGLSRTQGVVALFEQAFGIEMPSFLLTCRRAADDRCFRRNHPEPESLVLPT
jgi:AraC-like DNA-binding protein